MLARLLHASVPVLAVACCLLLASFSMAFESLEIPKESVAIDDLHPLPDLKAFRLMEDKQMACMREMSIVQCQRKVYTDDNQRLMVVFFEGEARHYWYFDPARKVASSQPIPNTKPADGGLMARDPKQKQPGAPNAGDYFGNTNKGGAGHLNLYKF